MEFVQLLRCHETRQDDGGQCDEAEQERGHSELRCKKYGFADYRVNPNSCKNGFDTGPVLPCTCSRGELRRGVLYELARQTGRAPPLHRAFGARFGDGRYAFEDLVAGSRRRVSRFSFLVSRFSSDTASI